MNNIQKLAEEIAARPYTELIMRDKTTDDDYIYVASTPELEGCIAQGETLAEAEANLRLFRIDYVRYLLENDLPVPEPSGVLVGDNNVASRVEVISGVLVRSQ